jgi:hypothetical protein
MVSYHRGHGYKNLSSPSHQPSDRVRYTVQDDVFDDSEGNDRPGFPYGHITLDYEEGDGTSPNFNFSKYAITKLNGISLEHHERTPDSAPTELFHTDPDRIVVSSAYAHPKMRKYIPKLLAIAQTDNPTTKLTASDDLTEYSSRLARNAVGKGLALPHPHNTNMSNNGVSIDPDDDEHHRRTMIHANPLSEETRIPQHDILKGEQFLRVALGRSPKPEVQPKTNNSQSRLPGME